MMIPMADSLATVNTFCTRVASVTLKQLTNEMRPEDDEKSFKKLFNCSSAAGLPMQTAAIMRATMYEEVESMQMWK